MIKRLRRTAGAALLALGGLFCPGAALAIEEPAFDVIEKSGRLEIRQYKPTLIAETLVDGDLDTASNRGFRLIADFIFGNNTAPRTGDAGGRIAMTAPVTAQPASEKIAMTAPVLVEPQDRTDPDALARAARWRIQFAMPAQYTLATLPRPNNPAVVVRELPGRRMAAVVFSGLAGEDRVREATRDLLAWMDSRGLKAIGAAQLARYNPPWTLPFWRRNEVLIEVEAPR
ncbi:MAG: heme-binding protein [Burkholderiales bacterium]|nr:heme-binding protein [Burkholderiales bacterium]